MLGRFLVLFLILHYGRTQECNLPADLIEEIKNHQKGVDQIIAAVIDGPYSGKTYEDMADFVDYFGNRLTGSSNLEDAIDNVVERMAKGGLEVHTEDVVVPNWTRGEESLDLLSPRQRSLSVLGLGKAPGTAPEGITAQVLIVEDYDQLAQNAAQVPGKIVLYNSKFVTYGQTVTYRNKGPNEASKLGAVAVLVRSITPFSLNTLHTGQTTFTDGEPIPAAAITLETADMLARFAAAGRNITVNLKLGARFGPDKVSRNVIADYPGTDRPDEFVVVSGHVDSWDVGTGAQDDAGGAFLSWHSLKLIKELGMTARRTLRAILWTGEELGEVGAISYINDHTEDLKKCSAAFESDGGIFEPIGFAFAGNTDATCILREIIALLASINITTLMESSSAGSDISNFPEVPKGEGLLANSTYMYYHHSPADSASAMDPKFFDKNLALYAATAYVIADLSIPLPRGNQTARQLIDAVKLTDAH